MIDAFFARKTGFPIPLACLAGATSERNRLFARSGVLLTIAECKSRTKLLEWLGEKGIKYLFTRRRRVVTTLDQVNRALEGEQREDIRIA